MSDIITVENTEMQIREYNGQRVVTFKDIDTIHQRVKGTARNAFNRNRRHFIKGVDYITLKPDEQENIDYVRLTYIPQKGITLLTESGYLMVVKAFTDDLSWQVQRQLVNTYFKAKEEPVQLLLSEEPEPKYKTSDTKIRLNPVWYERNRRTIEHICRSANLPKKTLYHEILMYLGEQYDLEYANYLYQKETGNPPKYPMDIVNYFTQLGEEADGYLKRLETKMRELNYM
jgi:hypothetical protein